MGVLGVQPSLYAARQTEGITMAYATMWNRFWCLVLGHSYSSGTGTKKCVNCGVKG